MTFEEKCQTSYYRCQLPYGKLGSVERKAYIKKQHELHTEFNADLRTFLLAFRVPEQYVQKVADIAYDQGHSGGYSEIMNCALTLADIFS